LLNRDEDPLMPALRVMAALVGEAPPQPAPDLPSGLFAAEHGPAWAQMVAGAIESWAVMRRWWPQVRIGSAQSRARWTSICARPARLDGHIGGVHRTLLSVPDGLVLDRSLIGTWREVNFGVELLIREDGTARWPWAGSVGRDIRSRASGRPCLGSADARHVVTVHACGSIRTGLCGWPATGPGSCGSSGLIVRLQRPARHRDASVLVEVPVEDDGRLQKA